MKNLPERKNIRLKTYDYSRPGRYFITVCIKKRMPILWNMDDTVEGMRASDVPLSEIGKIVERGILQIPDIYKNIKIDKYCIMPDHIHILLLIDITDDHHVGADIIRPQDCKIPHPTVSTVIGSLKRWVSKETGMSIWQKSFIDHVIRNEKGYINVWKYIDNNPLYYDEDDGILDFENL